MVKFTDEYFKEKAKNFIDDNEFNISYSELEILLKEVARDTRHACADINVEPDDQFLTAFSSMQLSAKVAFKHGQEAHAKACMDI